MIYLLTINYYSTELITRLLQSIQDAGAFNYQLIIVNNSPDDMDMNQLKDRENIHIIEAKNNLGFSNGCNLGLSWIYSQNKDAIVWLINPDAYFSSATLTQVQKFFIDYPDISILGTMIYTPNNKIWFAGGDFIPHLGEIISRNHLFLSENLDYFICDWVSACSMLINLKNFSSCPQFDDNYFLYYEDFDFCRRYFQQGHKLAFTTKLSVIHQPSSITNRNIASKLKHSTYSYLFTLKKYTNTSVFLIRLFRLIVYSLILLPIKPQASIGKITGIMMYFFDNRQLD